MTHGLMIFAAGFGTRMRPLTDTVPKPLIQVGGQTLLDRALGHARDAGSAPIVVNAHHRADRIVDHLDGQDIAIAMERDRILETGGGLKAALPLLPGSRVNTMNPDVIWDGPNPLTTVNRDGAGRPGATLLLVEPDKALGRVGRGDFAIDADGRLSRGGPLIYGGVQLIETAPVAAHPEEVFSLNAVWDALIAGGHLSGVVYPGRWCDVGRPESIALAEGMLADA